MVIEMQDEELLFVQPETIVGYNTYSEVGGSAENRPYR